MTPNDGSYQCTHGLKWDSENPKTGQKVAFPEPKLLSNHTLYRATFGLKIKLIT